MASVSTPDTEKVGAVVSSPAGAAWTSTETTATLAHTRRVVPTQVSVSRSSTVFGPGVGNDTVTLSPSPSASPSRVPFRYVQIKRQGLVHGVVDVNVIGSPTKYGPGEASAVAV